MEISDSRRQHYNITGAQEAFQKQSLCHRFLVQEGGLVDVNPMLSQSILNQHKPHSGAVAFCGLGNKADIAPNREKIPATRESFGFNSPMKADSLARFESQWQLKWEACKIITTKSAAK